MNSLFKSASIVCKNKQSLQFLKRSIFNFSSINKYRSMTQTCPQVSNNLFHNNKKFFWKKNDKKEEKNQEKGNEPESEDKPPKGFEKFHRKKKEEDKKETKGDENKNPDEDPNKGKI